MTIYLAIIWFYLLMITVKWHQLCNQYTKCTPPMCHVNNYTQRVHTGGQYVFQVR